MECVGTANINFVEIFFCFVAIMFAAGKTERKNTYFGRIGGYDIIIFEMRTKKLNLFNPLLYTCRYICTYVYARGALPSWLRAGVIRHYTLSYFQFAVRNQANKLTREHRPTSLEYHE